MECISDLVSIITPSYNTAQYIGETIESVLAQTYTCWEMIIVDDCSTDNTDEVVAGYGDNRIKYYKNLTNSGAAISRNRAIKEARGEWIAFLDSDDIWLPDKLEKQIRFMKEHKYYFSCTYSSYINEDSVKINKLDICPSKIGKYMLYAYDWISCLTAMYHAPTIGCVQIEDIKRRNDYAVFLQIIKKAKCYCLPECLAMYRVRDTSLSHTNRIKLIKAHYLLFRICEKKGIIASLILTAINCVMSVYRKFRYVKKDN